MVLRVLCEKMLALDKSLVLVFIDYSSAFDSVFHKFVDEALKKAGASPKVRAIYRVIYSAAAAFTSVPEVDNEKVKCEPFSIDRGVLHTGRCHLTPVFILVLELILRRHNVTSANKGVPLADIFAHLLGYADDVAVLEMGDSDGVLALENRVSDISEGSSDDADMMINVEKTKPLHVRKQDPVSVTTPEEASRMCKFTCPHLNCGPHQA